MSTTTYRRRYEQRHRERGLCLRCPTPSSKRLCEPCYVKARAAVRKHLKGRKGQMSTEQGKERTGLYILVFLILMRSCESAGKLSRIEAKIKAPQPCVEVQK